MTKPRIIFFAALMALLGFTSCSRGVYGNKAELPDVKASPRPMGEYETIQRDSTSQVIPEFRVMYGTPNRSYRPMK